MNDYKNIAEFDSIRSIIDRNNIKIVKNNSYFISDELIPVDLYIGEKLFIIQVNDEYDDLNFNNYILNFILVFRELKIIEDSSDFLNWSGINTLNANNSLLLAYYKKICNDIDEIRGCFFNNSINYFISDLDFQLNSGAIQLLRK